MVVSEKEVNCPFCGSLRHRVESEDLGLPIKVLVCLDCGQKFTINR